MSEYRVDSLARNGKAATPPRAPANVDAAFFTITPHIDDDDLDPYEMRLLVHIRRRVAAIQTAPNAAERLAAFLKHVPDGQGIRSITQHLERPHHGWKLAEPILLRLFARHGLYMLNQNVPGRLLTSKVRGQMEREVYHIRYLDDFPDGEARVAAFLAS